ncbi:uncharacterized protein TRAVEDRAFT_47956 [Trametes versicolor FP-101664 SS1]|uniref:uncharacterized protein n=1 Tax=Trametes versicolor (strain FP-101664) TaxID=717944 RepID=UPI0004622E29|nr:uncharacterized protein TRAVEDRAFT_47956 [Trametes versicolor FP-101664 SS1]EIW58814.1 hypothetical protein TRAVEDRAFT_47956 [Trametes versicolor FP-101664 SS1]
MEISSLRQTVKKSEPIVRVKKSEPYEAAVKHEPVAKCKSVVKSEPAPKYESVEKLEHTSSPPSGPLTNRFPIAIAGRSLVDISSLLTTPPHILKKQIPAYTLKSIHGCGFSVITLRVYWPGYEVLNYKQQVCVAGRTDGDIARDVAQVLVEFMKSALVSPCSAAQFAITPTSGYMNLERLCLCAIHQVKNEGEEWMLIRASFFL